MPCGIGLHCPTLTLVDIGVDFGRITTLRNLKHGLREALRSARREREGMNESSLDDERG